MSTLGTRTLVGDALAAAFAEALDSADADRLIALYDPDVHCDLNVPFWRFGVAGADALVELLAKEEFLPGYHLTWWEGRATPDGAVVETEARFDLPGGEGCFREVHLLRAGARGITEHVAYCTGLWDTATIEKQAREAPPVTRVSG